MAEISFKNQQKSRVTGEQEEQTVLSVQERKIFAIVFIVLAVLAIFGGSFLWKKNLTTGFFLNQKQLAEFIQEIKASPSSEAQAGAPVITDRTKDTDHDGLTDWEEVTIYHTNPYNADTDSDGVSDNQEVQKGTDPNCPEGQVCQGLPPVVASSSEVGQDELLGSQPDMWSNLNQNLDQSQVAPISVSSAAALQMGNLSSAELRQLLKTAGAKDEDLKKLTDTQLQQAWQDFLINSKKSQ